MPDTKKLTPLADESRPRALVATGLLDTEPEAAFDRFTKLAAKLLKVPMAAISLVDDQRQLFKSSYGMDDARSLPLTDSVCKHVVTSKQPLVVSDARTHYELRNELQLPVGHAFLVEGERLIAAELWHVDDPLTRRPFMSATSSAQFVASLGLPGRALKEGRPIPCADCARDADFQRAGAAQSSGSHAGFALPIRGGGRMVAVIECYADHRRPITPELLDALSIAAAMLGRVIERGPLTPE